MTLPESYYRFEEHMHTLEEENLKSDFCKYERPTRDKRWPVRCEQDDRYATRVQCDQCKAKRRENNG